MANKKNNDKNVVETYASNGGGMFGFLPPELAREFYSEEATSYREKEASKFHVTIAAPGMKLNG